MTDQHEAEPRESRPPSREMHRFTLKVPFSNTSVGDWWARQNDPSASVRALIRAEIKKHGYTDTLERRVEQEPDIADAGSES